MSPMKKIFTTVAAMVLALAMSVTAFAAPSVTNNTTLPTETVGSVTYIRNYSAVTATATDANGNAVNLAVRQLTAGEAAAARAAVAAKFGSNVDIMGAGDYHADGASESSPVTVTFNASVNAGDSVCIFHKHADGNWYVEDATAANGTVTAKFTSFSNMVIVRTATASNGNTTTPGSTDGANDQYVATSSNTAAGTSPKTADNGVAGMAMIVLACAGALVVVNRKKIA